MKHLNLYCYSILLIICWLFCSRHASAQLKADFTTKTVEGCAPFLAEFKNTSTGLTAAIRVEWSLGNGNVSFEKDASAIYSLPGTYTVRLVLRDNGQSVSKEIKLIVHPSPAVNFSADTLKGCAPFDVGFEVKPAIGENTDGYFYFWDFGDGSVQEITGTNTVQHQYSFGQFNAVSLVATNQWGCQTKIRKDSMVEVIESPKVDFTSPDSILCSLNRPVQFINKTSNGTNLSYYWSFGDGSNSTETEPLHKYLNPGQYNVSLQATTAEGCAITENKTRFITAGGLKPEIEAIPPFCTNTIVNFRNASAIVPAYTNWNIPGLDPSLAGEDSITKYIFYSSGSYTIRMINKYSPTCLDTTFKTFTIQTTPDIGEIVIEKSTECGSPVDVILKDTSTAAISWEWRIGWPPQPVAGTGKAHSFTIPQSNHTAVYLNAIAANGCTVEKQATVFVEDPVARIIVMNQDSQDPSFVTGCSGKSFQFMATGTREIASYKWTFLDDNSVSTESQPIHVYNKPGNHTVKLEFTTIDGCTGTVEYQQVYIADKPTFNVTLLTGPEICGNTPVELQGSSPGKEFSWTIDFGDGSIPSSAFSGFNNYTATQTYKYEQEGIYTMTITVGNDYCIDTLVLKDAVLVKPSFTKIHKYENTCDGTRGLVTFTDSSRQAEFWTWDFGDGTSASYSTYTPTIQHTYTKTGTYNAVLTTRNGNCFVKDSITAYVLLKQQPAFSVDQTEVCNYGKERVKGVVDQLEPNPWSFNYDHYSIYKSEYEDGSRPLNGLGGDYEYPHVNMYFYMDGDKRGAHPFRVIVKSTHFGCLDTTNYVTIKVNGPKAYPYVVEMDCSKGSVVLSDSSLITDNVPIIRWTWNLPDRIEHASGGTFTYKPSFIPSYGLTGGYLEVEDANGCISAMSFGFSLDAFLTAAFTADNAVVEPGTSVNFFNQTQYSDTKEVKYRWFVNGNQYSTETNSSFKFNSSGNYTIRLIADFTDQSCSDTSEQIIEVKNQNAAFALETGFVKNSGCPPLVVNFNATVQGNARVKWNFGDGSRSENIEAPSHTYHYPGKFYITMEAIFPNGDTIRGIDSVEVQGLAKADLDADNWTGCTSQQVELTTSGEGVIYAWDFGDGSVLTNNRPSALHAYRTSGIYKPTLLVMDAAGCRQLAETSNRIIIDSLSVSLNENPDRFCENNSILLTPSITSVAEQAGYALTYQWDLGSTAVNQFSTERIPAFAYSSIGAKNIQFSVQSPLGCRQTVSKSFTIDQLINGTISGPDNVCAGVPVQFQTTAQSAGLAWNWNLGNGQTSRQQNPDRVLYPAGNYQIELYTINQSCIHRAEKTILVSPLPDLQVSSSRLDVCEGESIRVTASGANEYAWSPVTGINQPNQASALITPSQTGMYIVKGTSEKGCSAEKQVSITVIPDYKLTVSPDTGICLGASVPIRVTGASSYQWIETVEGLSSLTSPTPVARPAQTTRYRVRTEGQAGCFVKETDITIEVFPLPQVQLGPDITTYAGNPVTLNPTTSQDVSRWKWSPANHLSCSDCPNPVARPVNDIVYQLDITNGNGCTASDEIKLIVGCDEDKIAIPNAFTPNADGKNDRFQIMAPGINEVESFQIYNRFGQMVHEVKNAAPGALGVAWDGRMNGNPQPAGTYVYYLQLRCSNNEKIVRKGTVVLIN